MSLRISTLNYRMLVLFALFLACLSVLTGATESHKESGKHSGHSHHVPNKDGPKNLLKDKNVLRDYEHIKEDLQEQYNKNFTDELDDFEMEVYYFQLHDLNNDKKLDGLELLAAMNHVLDRNQEESFSEEELAKNPKVRQSLQEWWNDKFEEDSKYIDEILKEEDMDQDGYLTYLEFAIGRQRDRNKS